MTAKDIQTRIEAMASHFTFRYAGKECGVDPLSPTHFDMWYGDETDSAGSVEAVMQLPLFGGRSLHEIAHKITDID